MKMNLKKIAYWASVSTIGLVVGISLQLVSASWTPPVGGAPGGNVGAPINTGNNVQIKSGTLEVDNALVVGKNTPTASTTNPNSTTTSKTIPANAATGKVNADGNFFANDVYIANSDKWASQAGSYSGGKVCELLNIGHWNSFMTVPPTWVKTDCTSFVGVGDINDCRLGCANAHGYSYGSSCGALPSPNCGW